MSSYKFINAYNPTKEQQRERNEAYKNFEFYCFLSESILIVGDMHFFYNNILELERSDLDMIKVKSFQKHLYIHSKPTEESLPKGWEIEEKYYVHDTGDFAWFFKNENGKLKYFASWTIGSLGLVDWEGHIKEIKLKSVDSLLDYQFYIDYVLKRDNWLKGLTVNDLEPVGEEMEFYLELIQNNEHGHVPLTGTLEKPYIEEEDAEEEE